MQEEHTVNLLDPKTNIVNGEYKSVNDKENEEKELRGCKCCDCCLATIYCLWRLTANLFPIYAQYKGIRYLIEHQSNQNTTLLKHFQLLCNGYVVFYVIYLVCQWYLAQTIVGVVVFKILYELVKGYVTIVRNLRSDLMQDPNYTSYLLQFLVFSVITFGIGFLDQVFLVIIPENWVSPNPWKRHVTQLLCGFIIFKLIWTLISYGLYWAYNMNTDNGLNWEEKKNPHSIAKQLLGHCCLTLATAGIYAICKYFHTMTKNLTNPYHTISFKVGVLQVSILTGGIVGLFVFAIRSRKLSVRWLCHVLLTAIYAFAAYIAWIKIKDWRTVIVVITTILSIYPGYFLLMEVCYNEQVRTILNFIWNGIFCQGYYIVAHALDYVKFLLQYSAVMVYNALDYAYSQCRTAMSLVNSNFWNEFVPWIHGSPRILLNDANYTPTVISPYTPFAQPVIRDFAQKMYDREHHPGIPFNNTTFCIRATISKLRVWEARQSGFRALEKHIFWATRYDAIHVSDTRLCVHNIPIQQFKIRLYEACFRNNCDILPRKEMTCEQYYATVQNLCKILHQLKQLIRTIELDACDNTNNMDFYFSNNHTLLSLTPRPKTPPHPLPSLPCDEKTHDHIVPHHLGAAHPNEAKVTADG